MGATNAVSNPGKETVEDETFTTLTITAEEAAASGMLTVELDEDLTLMGLNSPAQLSSYRQEGNTITFAYAGSEALAEGETLAVLRLKQTVQDATAVVTETERGGKAVFAKETVTFPGDFRILAANELQAYYDALLEKNEYSEVGKAALKAALDAGLETITASENAEAAQAALEAAKKALDDVLTYNEELLIETEKAQKAAEEAQKAAEEAQKKAEEAQKKAEEAQKAAEEAAASAAEDKEAAEKAKAEAEAAKEAAEAARKAAEDAQKAAEAARDAAAAHDAAAAEAAAEAAKYALEVAQKYEEICAMKAEMAQYLLDAQKAAEEAEAARKAAQEAELACAKYYALFTLSTYADKDDYAEAQQAELADAIEAGTKAINDAESIEAVDQALADAKAAIDGHQDSGSAGSREAALRRCGGERLVLRCREVRLQRGAVPGHQQHHLRPREHHDPGHAGDGSVPSGQRT